jgi:hypothetical protein
MEQLHLFAGNPWGMRPVRHEEELHKVAIYPFKKLGGDRQPLIRQIEFLAFGETLADLINA